VISRVSPRINVRLPTGYVALPALVNAHDHLSLNHYPRTRPRPVYASAHEWGADVNALLDSAPYRELRAYPLWDRLFIGGLKNLLCGALTVMHHDPPHRELWRRAFPVRVIRRYGWAHSFGFSSADEIARAYRRTPRGADFFIHLAEGTDERAALEYAQLHALGAVARNSVLIHGVGLTQNDIAQAAPKVRALVCCVTTNRYLLGNDPPIDDWQQAGGTLWIGSDSRLTADGDLLDEIAALSIAGDSAVEAIRRVQRHTMMPGGSPDDWIALRADAVMPITRADIALIVRAGRPLIGDPDLIHPYTRRPHVGALLDGRPKEIDAGLARLIRACGLQESGLTVE